MTEPIDQATKHECEFFLCQDDRAYLCECGRIEFNHETFYPESEITSLREKLKQERNKVIDECINTLYKTVTTETTQNGIIKILESLKDKSHE